VVLDRVNADPVVLWGRCYEGQGAPPYWPWVQPRLTQERMMVGTVAYMPPEQWGTTRWPSSASTSSQISGGKA